MKEINLGDRNVLENYKNKFEELIKKAIRENLDVDINNVNSIGNVIFNAKNCYQVFITFPGHKKTENIRYSTDVGEITDGMDLYIVGPNVSLGYELVEAMESSNIKFSYFISNCLDVEYSLNCHGCQHCFACSGLRKKSYCIFNEQYSKEEYYQLVDKIKTKMLLDGEYGEFFPLSQSLHEYNNTYAMVEFPLTKEEVKKNGWQWYDEPKVPVDLKGLNSIKAKDISVDIRDIKDNILNKAIICEKTEKPFKLIKPELDFCRKHNLSIPTIHPYQRMMDRFKKRNPTKLWQDKCDKCGKEMMTSYSPEKQKELKIYCHKCYIKEIG